MIIVFSPFDFEKLCLKGGLDRLASLSPSHGQFFAVCKVAWEKFSGREEISLLFNGQFPREKQGSREKYFPFHITNGHFFGLCPKKVLRLGRRGLCFNSKRSFHYPTDKINQSVTILSRGHFLLTLQRTFFGVLSTLCTSFLKKFLFSPSTFQRTIFTENLAPFSNFLLSLIASLSY